MLECGLLISFRGAGWSKSGTAVPDGRSVADAGRGAFPSGGDWRTSHRQAAHAASGGEPKAGGA